MLNMAYNAIAQPVVIQTRNETIRTKVVTSDESKLFIPGSFLLINDILKIDILSDDSLAHQLAIKLVNANVKVTINGQISDEMKNAMIFIKYGEENSNREISNAIKGFKKQRQLGKGLQLVGIILTTGSIAMQAYYNKQYETDLNSYKAGPLPKQKFVNPAVPILGSGFWTVGFVIDFGAGRKLSLKY